MRGRHGKTLELMQAHPRPANLLWKDVESLPVHVGAEVIEGRGSAITVILRGQVATFHRPHPGKEANKGAVVNALRLLRRAGIMQ